MLARRLVLLLLVALVCVGVVIIFTRREKPASLAPSRASLSEVNLTNLVLIAGQWTIPGGTNTFTGFMLETYPDGLLKSRSIISNGLPWGLSEGWYTNGQKQVDETFVAGTSHGVRTKWYPGGQKLSEANIVDGKLQGTFRRWHENGQLAEELLLKDDKPDGVSRGYYPSGFLKAEATMLQGNVVTQRFWKDGETRHAF